jgi:hypothetical protein
MSPRWPLPARTGRLSTPVFIRVYIVVVAVAMALALLLYFHRLALRVEDQTESKSALVAHLIAFTTFSLDDEAAGRDAQTEFRRIIRSLDFPVIITADSAGLPLVWNRLVGADTLSIDRILAEDPANPSPALARVLSEREHMDRSHDPIPMLRRGSEGPAIYLHYGSPGLVNELRWTPWVTIAVAAIFGAVGLVMIRGMKRAEQGFIWAGMAKETAHQMGTPLSSLVGWMEVLKDEAQVSEDRATLPRELYEEAVHEIDRDAERLNQVAARFSQIGSKPRLERGSPVPVLQQTIDYFRRRFPQGVELAVDLEPDTPPVLLNNELFGWVLENLIKNALNAVEEGRGRIEVRLRGLPAGKGVAISVRDNGRGVAAGMEAQIFRPGVSTRARGWGLGLPLSRRIVEEYHRGRLDLTWTEPGKGAEFTMTLPAAPAAAYHDTNPG